jgi:hypothetical protein
MDVGHGNHPVGNGRTAMRLMRSRLLRSKKGSSALHVVVQKVRELLGIGSATRPAQQRDVSGRLVAMSDTNQPHLQQAACWRQPFVVAKAIEGSG